MLLYEFIAQLLPGCQFQCVFRMYEPEPGTGAWTMYYEDEVFTTLHELVEYYGENYWECYGDDDDVRMLMSLSIIAASGHIPLCEFRRDADYDEDETIDDNVITQFERAIIDEARRRIAERGE